MKAWREQGMAYWRQRSPREQRLLAAMAAVLGAATLYLGVWEPASQSLARNRASVQKLQAELGYVQSLAAEADKLKRQPAQTALPARELMPLIRQVAQAQGLPPAGWQLNADGEYGVTLEGVVNFDAWTRVAGVLAAQHQVRIESMRLEAQPAPGQAHIKALLLHAGGQS
ncbi:hypothetical protein CEK28_16280 [Xenophilus sp. AP218F]|nr:hypothetical protein CEK28_16280 [Xenophilus sp. AP218F]